MSEFKDKKPVNLEEFKGFKNLPYSEEFRSFLKSHRIGRRIINSALRILYYEKLFLSKEGREMLKDPAKRNTLLLLNRENTTGLLEGSILNPDLYHPNKESTSIEITSAPAGRYVGFDFHRPMEFGIKKGVFERQKSAGRICVIALDEVYNNNPDTYTPTSLLNFWDLTHLLCLDFPPLEKVLENGFLKESTYKEAYANAGLYERYRLALIHSGVFDKPVYVVTPKGNTLVGLIKDGGKKMEKPKSIPELKPAFEMPFCSGKLQILSATP